MNWTWVWVYYTGKVKNLGPRATPWDSNPEWALLVETDSLVVAEWLGNPRVKGNDTVRLIISVKND